MKWFETRTRVRWSEVDSQGIVYYANYFTYFDLAREHLILTVGLDYINTGVDVLTMNCDAKFHTPARYLDDLIVRVAIRYPEVPQYSFQYQIQRAIGRQVLVEGTSRHCLVDRKTRKLVTKVPEEYRDLFLDAGIFPNKVIQ
ncbi:acyl-CoA thioester hydrolase [Paenibacillus shirakamiensis]|uniref:Acyl-CoA thioester hydrolase n=1 Tax=Paenibacillus shirakamiensis TaxID=1265935 RepID=A0ABS4JFH3_9BACL|nr:thioesterase family protein [Paenibacillus shirakamiensis]MBP2000458.1 acyl-CoA thioester hydrolase [Paenibacillus shirakamiensis]